MPIPLHFPRPDKLDELVFTTADEPQPSVDNAPLGYHAMVQLRPSFMQYCMKQVLRARGLDVLHARAPWGTVSLPPGLAAVAAQHTTLADSVMAGTSFELQLRSPVITALNDGAPDVFDDASTSGTMARILHQRTCEVRWQVVVSLFRAAPINTVSMRRTVAWHMPTEVLETGGGPAAPPPAGDRIQLGMGTARMTLPLNIVELGQGHQSWAALLTTEATPALESTDAAMTELFASASFPPLLAQALAPFQDAGSLRVTPVVMPGGDLPSGQLPRAEWGSLEADLLVHHDERGPFLALGLRDAQHTAHAHVTSFLANKEFAYYVGERIFSPLVKARWRRHVPHQPLVGDVKVEVPLEEGSDETGIATAHVSMLFHQVLERCTVEVTNGIAPDVLCLAGMRTVRLLDYWDPQGRRAEDLGALADPTEIPMVLALRMYDRPPGTDPSSMNAVVKDLLGSTVFPLYVPFADPIALTALSGKASAPLRALFVRWNIKRTPPGAVATPVQDLGALAIH